MWYVYIYFDSVLIQFWCLLKVSSGCLTNDAVVIEIIDYLVSIIYCVIGSAIF